MYKIQDYAKDIPAGIRGYVTSLNLSLGVYVQEFAIDSAALSLITGHVNENSTLFSEGLAWGGEGGVTVGGVQPGWRGNTDGLWAQRLVGRGWDYAKTADTLFVHTNQRAKID